MLQLARQEFGTLDILAANAGVQEDASDMTLLSVNLTDQFLCARAAIQERDDTLSRFRHQRVRPFTNWQEGLDRAAAAPGGPRAKHWPSRGDGGLALYAPIAKKLAISGAGALISTTTDSSMASRP